MLIANEKDLRRLLDQREEKELEALRARLRIRSIEDSDERMQTVAGALDAQEKALLEAYAVYDPDADVDFETALNNAGALDVVERHFDHLGQMWTNQRKRVEYLAREATK